MFCPTRRSISASFFGLPAERVAPRLLERQPLLLGFSLFFNNAAETLGLIRFLRARGVRSHVTLGGHHATFNCEQILAENPGVDSIVRGEGEEALAELVDLLASGRDWRGIANLAYRDEPSRVRVTECRPLIDPLGSLPFPSRRHYGAAIGEDGAASIVSSRGCFGRCSFCSIRPFNGLSSGRPWRGSTPERVADEVEALVRDYGVRHLNFADDDFFGTGKRGRDRALAIADALREREPGVTFLISCRPDNLDEEVLLRLKEAGLICVDIGAESFVPRQLALYDKRLTVERNWQALDLLRRTGIEYRVYLIPFDPYVSVEELWENAEAAQRIGARHLLDMFAFSHILVFRGTPLEARLRGEGLLRPPARPLYEGEMEYSFLSPEAGRLFQRWHGVQPGYARLDRRAKKLFDLKRCNHAERSFSLELQLALKQSILDLFRGFITAFREGDPAGGEEALERGMGSLDRDMSAIERAKEEGRFGRFLPMRPSIGGRVLEYPPQDIRDLGEHLVEKLAGVEG